MEKYKFNLRLLYIIIPVFLSVSTATLSFSWYNDYKIDGAIIQLVIAFILLSISLIGIIGSIYFLLNYYIVYIDTNGISFKNLNLKRQQMLNWDEIQRIEKSNSNIKKLDFIKKNGNIISFQYYLLSKRNQNKLIDVINKKIIE